MQLEELKEKAMHLPFSPGVYIMRDKANDVIYVGKAKKLKNRVSQYFQDSSAHSAKTRMMVSKIADFDVIVTGSEFEALVLECSLIKRHMPKYNILLKDDKGFPYVRLDMKRDYPQLMMVNKVQNDDAEYFGPFGSRGVTQNLLISIRQMLMLPSCNRKFPQDIGKDRPCLHYHMNQCEGWCQEGREQKAYKERMDNAKQLLSGNYKQVAARIKSQMLEAAEGLQFELAASLRDRLQAVESLGKKQSVTAGASVDTDAIGFVQNDTKACFAVLHFNDGNLVDKEYEILHSVDDQETAVSSLISQYYLSRGFAPKSVLLPFFLEDRELLEQLINQNFGNKTNLLTPQRGDNARLVELARMNASEEVERATSKEEKNQGVRNLLQMMLNVPSVERIESFDISNIAGTDIVASMVVFVDGKPKKGDYKRFAIRDLKGQDDYASMHQVITRRFSHFTQNDRGFEQKPDLLLIDGGVNHAKIAADALSRLDLDIPVFGMVKDDRHRTRALVTPEGAQISIDTQQSVFSFIGAIQEETHRFAITYHRQKRSKRLKYSQLDAIVGIGPKRKQELLKTFRSIAGIRNASMEDLLRVLPADAANSVFRHFHQDKEG